MFYTIEGSNGKLIVIDGGWVMMMRKSTRYHKETGRKGKSLDYHIRIRINMSELLIRFLPIRTGIQIDQVIAPKINASRYRHYQYPWDEYQGISEVFHVL